MTGARVGQRVAPVGEGVHNDVGRAKLDPQFDQRTQVAQRRVHAAVGDEPDQVNPARSLEGRAQHAVGRERVRVAGFRLDGVVDAHEVLAHYGARAEVQMTDLGVAHLPVGQAHRLPAGAQRGVRVAAPQLVEDRRARERHRVARRGLGKAPAVEHDQAGSGHGQLRRPGRDPPRLGGEAHPPDAVAATAPAATISAKEATFSDAPPTSAPSTSGSASSSGAFSALTEPP